MSDEFQPQSRRNAPRAVDGFLSGPSRQPLNARQLTGRLSGVSPSRQPRDGVRTTRAVGDFKRPEGYHSANPLLNNQGSNPRQSPQPSHRQTRPSRDESLLGASLQSPKAHDKKKAGAFPRAKGKGGRDWKGMRKWSLRGGIVVVALAVLIGGFLFTKGFFKANKVFKGGGSAAALNANVNPSQLKGEGDGRINILLLGKGGGTHAGADLTDTILLASIDPVNKRAALVSIPRDLWVARGGSMKINAVYATAKNAYLSANRGQESKAQAAGVRALQGTVGDVLGVPIHYYTMVDFTAFKQAVDTVGGVDINVPEPLAVQEKLWDETTRKNYYLNVASGQQHFDGTRALFFTRTRHTSTRGDFDRAERQRLFIAALSHKVVSAGTYTNPLKISQLMDAFGDHVATDLSLNDAVALATIGKKVGAKIDSIGLTDQGHNFLTTGMLSGQSVVIPLAGQGDYSEIQKYIRSALKDGYITKENATITILNGTTMPGLAGTKADQLKTYGYNVGTVADAPTQDYERTVIVDLTKGKKPYTKNYLQKRYNAKVVTKLPDQQIKPGTASFVIILGDNETTTSSN